MLLGRPPIIIATTMLTPFYPRMVKRGSWTTYYTPPTFQCSHPATQLGCTTNTVFLIGPSNKRQNLAITPQTWPYTRGRHAEKTRWRIRQDFEYPWQDLSISEESTVGLQERLCRTWIRRSNRRKKKKKKCMGQTFPTQTHESSVIFLCNNIISYWTVESYLKFLLLLLLNKLSFWYDCYRRWQGKETHLRSQPFILGDTIQYSTPLPRTGMFSKIWRAILVEVAGPKAPHWMSTKINISLEQV